MEEKKNPNGVNEEKEVAKKAAPPPMKRAKKGEQSAAIIKAAEKAKEKATEKKASQKAEKRDEKPEKKEEKIVSVKPEENVDSVKKEKEEVKKEAEKETKAMAVPVAEKKENAEKTPQKEEKESTETIKENENEEAKSDTDEKKEKKVDKKLLKIIIPIIAVVLVAVIVAVALVSGKDKLEPIVVTDENGVPVTDENGNVITVQPETEVVVFTDVDGNPVTNANGEVLTTIVFKDLTAQIPVTDMNGVIVTDANGNVVTTNISVDPTGNSNITTGANVVGTSSVLVTDGVGNTAVDEQGNPLTTIVNITEPPVIDIEPAKTEWKNTQGGSAADRYEDVILTSDSCYITLNVTNSKDGDFTQYKNLNLAAPYSVLTKYNENGEIVWQKTFGSSAGSLELTALAPCKDGSFYAVGYGKAIEDLQVKGWYDSAIYKIDKNGNIQWVKSFGTSTIDTFTDVVTTSNGDAVVVGYVGNNDGDASDSKGEAGKSKAIILRYNSAGKLLWKEYAGANQDVFTGVVEAKDGSLFVLGHFFSGNLFQAMGKKDAGVLKYSSKGVLLERTSIAGSGIEEFEGITATSDGGVVVCGASDSSDTVESSFFKGDYASRGGYDSYIIKYTKDLEIDFVTPLRGQNNDEATSVIELSNGTFIMSGSTNSSTRDFKGVTTRGKKDIFVACFNEDGILSWVRSFGGTENDGALALCKGADGGYVVVGETKSKDLDLEGIAPYGGNGFTLAVMIKFPE